MAQASGGDRFGEWQTGVLIVLAVVAVGLVGGFLLLSVSPPYGPLAGFVGGGAVGFLLVSYLLYGR